MSGSRSACSRMRLTKKTRQGTDHVQNANVRYPPRWARQKTVSHRARRLFAHKKGRIARDAAAVFAAFLHVREMHAVVHDGNLEMVFQDMLALFECGFAVYFHRFCTLSTGHLCLLSVNHRPDGAAAAVPDVFALSMWARSSRAWRKSGKSESALAHRRKNSS